MSQELPVGVVIASEQRGTIEEKVWLTFSFFFLTKFGKMYFVKRSIKRSEGCTDIIFFQSDF